jgi:hypothetical protein
MPALHLALALLVAAAAWSCSGAPTSPSALSPSTGGNIARAFDEGDEGGEPMPPGTPAPEPAPGPPAPGPEPAPGPGPEPGPAPAPPAPPAPGTGAARLMVSIVSSFGPGAYLPNPLWDAVVGTMLVWNNEDTRPHHIVLEDGRDLGLLMPGQMSAAVPLTTESTSYQCALHPSMFGTINRMLPPEEEPYPEYGSRRRPQR